MQKYNTPSKKKQNKRGIEKGEQGWTLERATCKIRGAVHFGVYAGREIQLSQVYAEY